mmetsp:Transcript_26048/g.32112  ORF Transcript_26048/g.32112 Transcript_26048/m.32112 type:complete len:112 (+) Transcript_26048:389-724(+)
MFTVWWINRSFLTSTHCGITNGNAASVVVYWNYITSECGRFPYGDLNQFTSGATFITSTSASDLTLLRLNSNPDPAYAVTFAGWDNSPFAHTISSGVAIHHPMFDERKNIF